MSATPPGAARDGVDAAADAGRTAPAGLSSAQADAALRAHGPNTVADAPRRPWRDLLRKLWGPVPWMLEAVIALQLTLGKTLEAGTIAILLMINAAMGVLQEGRANEALALLKSRLAIQGRVRRDGRWQLVPAPLLVPGDLIHLRAGDLVPADVRLSDGMVQLDLSTLTGESAPAAAGSGALAYAGSMVRHGEATGEITATGTRTFFGRTAELVRTAGAASHLQSTILAIVRYLIALDAVLVGALLIYAMVAALPLAQVVPFALILLVASVPVALPATFTLATALGARELAAHGVLVTRLSAIEEAAAMDVLACDKTGTITQNRLALAGLQPWPGQTDERLLRCAALASDDATQDPIDLALLAAAGARGLLQDLPPRTTTIPFDPQSKRSESVYREAAGPWRVLKGAPPAIAALCAGRPDTDAAVQRLAAGGYRVLGVAQGGGSALEFVGLVALQDPPRPGVAQVIEQLRAIGVRALMITGDGLATARAVAAAVGIGSRACSADVLRSGPGAEPSCDVYAGVLPQDKFRPGADAAARRPCHRHDRRWRERCAGAAPGRSRDRGRRRHRRGQGGGQPGADQCRPGRHPGRRAHQPADPPAHAHLHAQQDHQDAGDRVLPFPWPDADGHLRHHADADRAAALYE